DGVGGTWRANSYPGAACDTESHLYSYSFEPHADVSRLYARQPELLNYAHRLIERHGLRSHIVYNLEIVSADWDANLGRWTLSLHNG
ncbi:MAG: NAD(P)/FAD-dependent oxidoreductase, partial [Pseudomonadota bacterium]